MFVDYSSEKDALRAQGLVADFLVPLFTNRDFKPFVRIKGGGEFQVVNNIDIGSQVHNVGTGVQRAAPCDFCKLHLVMSVSCASPWHLVLTSIGVHEYQVSGWATCRA
jgi:hypothetical protein